MYVGIFSMCGIVHCVLVTLRLAVISYILLYTDTVAAKAEEFDGLSYCQVRVIGGSSSCEEGGGGIAHLNPTPPPLGPVYPPFPIPKPINSSQTLTISQTKC